MITRNGKTYGNPNPVTNGHVFTASETTIRNATSYEIPKKDVTTSAFHRKVIVIKDAFSQFGQSLSKKFNYLGQGLKSLKDWVVTLFNKPKPEMVDTNDYVNNKDITPAYVARENEKTFTDIDNTPCAGKSSYDNDEATSTKAYLRGLDRANAKIATEEALEDIEDLFETDDMFEDTVDDPSKL
ncbi:hypothetical protein ElyMa_001257500 [Elysia marginata]|uniref:Uncharacterized protein n=1 Tax=Elysia marginata TaxID=1093978 RepID=A0AAV4IBX0_9GAST|nr:hypothetical protein ElyMa_001257500 [Elysia marginata]